MLANGHVEVEEEACVNAGLKFSAICNSVSLNDATFDSHDKSSMNCDDVFSFSDSQAEDTVPDVKFEIDDKCSMDDDNFELRILNDDENEIPEVKFDSKFDHVGDECSFATDSADLSDNVNNNGDGKVRKLNAVIAGGTSRSKEAPYDCVWCAKHFSTKTSLKFHLLSHLRKLKPNAKDGVGVPSSGHQNGLLMEIPEIDGAAADTNVASDFACVFCRASFPDKKSVIVHYITNHRQSDAQTQNKATALNGRYWQSGDKIAETATAATVVPTSAERNPIPNADENAVNEDTPKQYKCCICDKQFSRNSSLMWHLQIHETSKCPKFEKSSQESAPASLAEANGAAAGVEEGDDNGTSAGYEYTCNFCDCHFPHRSNYLQHMSLAHHVSADEIAQKPSGHKCESCGKFFSTSSNMRKHARQNCKGLTSMLESEDGDGEDDDGEDEAEEPSEDPLKEFPCDICDRSFFSQRAVNIHRSSKHRDELSDTAADSRDDPIPCDSYTEIAQGEFQCNVCEKMFETRKGVIRHIGYHRSAANESNKSGNGASDDESENVDGEVACPECGKTFASVRGMRIHANKHLQETDDDHQDESIAEKTQSSFECHVCSKTFEGLRSFKIHMSWHSRREETIVTTPLKKIDTVVAPQKKPDATETVGTPQKNPDHSTESTEFTSPSKIHQCQYCPRWYTTQQALAGHMKVHQSAKVGTPPDRPPVKAQPLKTASSQASQQIRTADKKMCQVCGQNISGVANFNEHMRAHIAEAEPATSSGQPLALDDTMECEMCSKSFMRKQDMAKHMRDHMNNSITRENVDLSLFRCIHCPKSFVGRKSLLTHQRLHEEAQVALKRAADQLLADPPPAKQSRQSEVEAPVPEESVGWENMMSGLQCEECDRVLATKQSLRRHMEWHARMQGMHGRLPATKAPLASAPPKKASTGLLEEPAEEEDEMRDEGADPVFVNDDLPLGEHAVVQCVEAGGNEEYFVFEQREGEAFQCSECDETHIDKLQMIVHMAYHVGKRWANGRQRSLIIKANPIMLAPFECMFCDERFVNKVFRSNHVIKRHGDDVLQCGSCRKLFVSKRRLAAHCQVHLSDPVYRCDHCDKCFTSKWFLKRHTRKICFGESSQKIKEELSYSTSDVESSNDE